MIRISFPLLFRYLPRLPILQDASDEGFAIGACLTPFLYLSPHPHLLGSISDERRFPRKICSPHTLLSGPPGKAQHKGFFWVAAFGQSCYLVTSHQPFHKKVA